MTHTLKHFDVHLLKVGKILSHITKVGSKTYQKSKLYFRNSADVDKHYELYDMGEVLIEEVFGKVKGKGILIFLPDEKRKKSAIKLGYEPYV